MHRRKEGKLKPTEVDGVEITMGGGDRKRRGKKIGKP